MGLLDKRRFWSVFALPGLALGLFACQAELTGPNRAPVAVAGSDRRGSIDEQITLDGSSSWDPDGDRLRHRWSLLSAPLGVARGLADADSERPTLVPDVRGTWVIGLVVTDEHGLSSARDVIQIRVAAACAQDPDCDDGQPCTDDTCLDGICSHEARPDCPDDCPDDPQKTDPGQCGCGNPDTDSDADGTADCLDACPDDPAKTAPGSCGCGQPEDPTDGDGDGVPDCLDACPNDPLKTEPGLCGCGLIEEATDSDGDGAADCVDGCPQDSDKTSPGQCGCGNSDLDTDADGAADCVDACPDDPLKTEPGQCGCGQPEDWGDSDGDGVSNCLDGCPNDPLKTSPGVCGCGLADDGRDTDADGVWDCLDGCPIDADKIEPGQCGCGFTDADSDGDGVADCLDGCPSDPLKTTPGACGCNAADTDSDNDATPDCLDNCPTDPAKTEPGACGCNAADTDSDNDATPDCLDNCPTDPAKTEPGVCGCGESEVDSDGDGTADCDDGCPADPGKIDPGQCGCQVADTDDDGDGTPNCLDACPADPLKTEPGICGCGSSDADSDGDLTVDCQDGCPLDPAKTDPGLCGCGALDSDLDGDSFCDGDDCAPNNPAIFPGASETCNAVDDNCDGVIDDAGCPCSMGYYGEHAYFFCDSTENWTTARDICRGYRYELATVDDATENSALWALIGSLLSDGSAWHGLNDRATEGTWRWVSGSTADYRTWVGGQPDDFFGQDCVLWWDGQGGRWNDRDCSDDSYRYVCESNCGSGLDEDGDGYDLGCDCAPLDPTVHPGATETCNFVDDDCNGVIDQLPACPCAVGAYNGHHYLFCNSAADWPTARDACVGYGAALSSLEDLAENDWVHGRIAAWLGNADAWHGYNDLAQEGVWAWINGSGSSWTNWSGSEPNNAGGVENCAHWYSDGTWNDSPCTDSRPYVCEYDY